MTMTDTTIPANEPPAPLGPADADTAPTSGQPAGDATGNDRDDGRQRGGNAEAARYRTQLRTVEAERDQLRTVLAGTREREVQRLAGERMADGTDLARFGVNVDGLLDDDGQVDADKVTTAVDELLAQRPHLQGRRGPRPDRSQGTRGTGHGSGADWQDLLRNGTP
jgi:hypothetical protein